MYERAFNRGSNLRRLEIQLWEKRKSCIQEGGREGGRAERGGEKRNPDERFERVRVRVRASS